MSTKSCGVIHETSRPSPGTISFTEFGWTSTDGLGVEASRRRARPAQPLAQLLLLEGSSLLLVGMLGPHLPREDETKPPSGAT